METMLSLDDLLAFVKTAETKSFTRAAEQLGTSKSRVSLRVRALEEQLSVALLQRSTRAVQLTSAGDELLDRARALLADADRLSAAFKPEDEIEGEVRADLPVGLALRVVMPRLPELFARHPRLSVFLSTTDRRVDLVREGFDCVLRVGALKDSSLMARKIGAMEMVNAASPAYLRKFGVPSTPAHLASHHIVHYGAGAPSFEHGKTQVPMRATVTVNSTDAYQAACLAGLGIIQAPRFGLQRALDSGALVEILPRHRCAPLPVALVHAHKTRVPPRLEIFMRWLTEIVTAAL